MSAFSSSVMVTMYVVMFMSEKGGVQVRRIVDCVVSTLIVDGALSNPNNKVIIQDYQFETPIALSYQKHCHVMYLALKPEGKEYSSIDLSISSIVAKNCYVYIRI